MARFQTPRPSVGRRIYRAHGLGNDYLVVAEGDAWRADHGAVRAVCDRREGVGSDGIVVVLDPDAGEPYHLRMFNPDGSEFERSGNGLRVAASWLHRTGRVSTGQSFVTEVGGEVVRMETHGRASGGVFDVSVAMGRASVGPEAVRSVELDEDALAPDAPMGADGWLETASTGPLPVHIVSVGNPHCVVFVGALGDDTGLAACFSERALHRMGPGLATHRAFANGSNVQLARMDERGDIDLLIWERGVGPTRASGTSSCAAAVAAVASGRRPAGDVTLRMPGGVLQVRVTDALDVTLRGPVQEVCEIELTDGFLESLSGSP
jgi:diaminopimelate epimerase